MSFISRLKTFLTQEAQHLEDYHLQSSEKIDDTLEETADSLKEYIDSFDSRIRSIADDVSSSSDTFVERASSALTSARASVKGTTETLATKAREMAKDNASGKYLTVNILSRDDVVLAQRGDMVTYALIEKAEQVGKLDQIFRNLSKKPVETVPLKKSTPRKRTSTV